MKVNNLKVNFLDQYYLFYDWLISDNILEIKNVPVHLVNSKIIKDLMNNKIKIKEDTFIKKHKIHLFSDEFNFVVIKFSEKGLSIKKSSLLLADELRLLDNIQDLHEETIDYIILEKDMPSPELRIEGVIKMTIVKELNKLSLEQNTDKIKYLYYEWFKKNEDNNYKMINQMLKKISRPLTSDEIYIYNFIKNCYKLV